MTASRRFVQAAAMDPAVDQIRMTGYRIGRKSAIAEALLEAAKRVREEESKGMTYGWRSNEVMESTRADDVMMTSSVPKGMMS